MNTFILRANSSFNISNKCQHTFGQTHPVSNYATVLPYSGMVCYFVLRLLPQQQIHESCSITLLVSIIGSITETLICPTCLHYLICNHLVYHSFYSDYTKSLRIHCWLPM